MSFVKSFIDIHRIMNSTSVLSVGNSDLSSLSKEEASKNLFSQIHWEEVLRSGVALQHRDVSYLYFSIVIIFVFIV